MPKFTLTKGDHLSLPVSQNRAVAGAGTRLERQPVATDVSNPASTRRMAAAPYRCHLQVLPAQGVSAFMWCALDFPQTAWKRWRKSQWKERRLSCTRAAILRLHPGAQMIILAPLIKALTELASRHLQVVDPLPQAVELTACRAGAGARSVGVMIAAVPGGEWWAWRQPCRSSPRFGGCAEFGPGYDESATPGSGPIAWPDDRPRTALVLGSGGPRGFAHIGVLKVLGLRAIEPTLVVGSSAGAIAGCCGCRANAGCRD